METQNSFPNVLRSLRKARKLTQHSLAECMQMTRTQLTNYERGTREPDLNTLIKFAQFFNVSTDYLLGVSDFNRNEAIKTVSKSLDSLKSIYQISNNKSISQKVNIMLTDLYCLEIELKQLERRGMVKL